MPRLWGGASLKNPKGYDCEDYFVIKDFTDLAGEEVTAFCVADGAGSKPEALAGATGVSEAPMLRLGEFFEDYEANKLTPEHITQWVTDFKMELELKLNIGLLEGSRGSVLDYSCTFLCAIVFSNQVLFFQVGDGAIIYSTQENPDVYKLVCMPMKGQFANQTVMITSDSFISKAYVETLKEPLARLCMFTDGIEDAFIDFAEEKVIDKSFHKVFPFIEDLAPEPDELSVIIQQTLDSEPLVSSSRDDKTLVYYTSCPK